MTFDIYCFHSPFHIVFTPPSTTRIRKLVVVTSLPTDFDMLHTS